MEKVKMFAKIPLLIGLAIFMSLILLNIQLLMNKYVLFFIPIVLVFLFTGLLVIKLRLKNSYFIMLLFLFAFIFKATTVYYLKTEPISNFKLFWQAANQIATGQRDFLHWGYFNVWAYQTGIVIYYAAVIKIFGSKIIILQLINCIWLALTNVLIYLISKKLSNENGARITALLYLIYPEPYFICSTLSNQILGDFLIYLAAYLFICKKVKAGLFLAGIIGAVGNAIRPTGIILILAVLLTIGFGLFSYNNLNCYKIYFRNSIRRILPMSLSYLIVGFLISTFVQFSGLNPYGLKNNFTLYKFVVGLNMETYGGYSNADAKLTEIVDTKQRNILAQNIITERLSEGPIKLGGLFYNKVKNMWADFDTLEWSFSVLQKSNVRIGNIEVTYSRLSRFILLTEKIFYILILIISLISTVIYLRKKEVTSNFLIFLFVFMIYFGLHLFIEIQVRYRYFAIISLFILSSKGLQAFIDMQKKQLIRSK